MAGQIFNGNINAQATAWMMINMLAFAGACRATTAPPSRAGCPPAGAFSAFRAAAAH